MQEAGGVRHQAESVVPIAGTIAPSRFSGARVSNSEVGNRRSIVVPDGAV